MYVSKYMYIILHTYMFMYILYYICIYYICIYNICIYYIIYVYYSPTFAVQNDLNLASQNEAYCKIALEVITCQEAWEAANHDVFRHGRCQAVGRWWDAALHLIRDPWHLSSLEVEIFTILHLRYLRYSPDGLELVNDG